MNILYIGIDLSLKTNQVAIVDKDGKQIANFKTGNDALGAQVLTERIIATGKRLQINAVEIGMEATNLYWWHLYRYLLQDKKLHEAFSVKVYTINPKIIKRFHRVYQDLDKTDPIDAVVIADRVRFGKLNPNPLIDEQYEPLKRATRFRYHLVTQLIREENYFFNYLFLKFSSWQKLAPLSSPFGVTAEEIITEFDSEKLLLLPLEELAQKISATSRNTLADPQKTAQQIKQVALASYRLEKKFQEPIDVILGSTYDNIRFFHKKIGEMDTFVEKEFKRYPNTLTSIPGIGLVYAAGITAELGTISRFQNHNQVAKFAGLTWKKTQSGESEAEDTPRKPGNCYARYYLCQAAFSLRNHNEQYREIYERKAREVPKHQHKRALVLTARKLVRLCVALLRDQKLYQQGYCAEKGFNRNPRSGIEK